MPSKKATKKKQPDELVINIEGNVDAVVRAFSDNPDAPAIHASSIAVLASPVDIVLLVAQLDTTPEGARMKKAATIFFSPGHAKQLAGILTSKIAEHEAQFGPISPLFFKD